MKKIDIHLHAALDPVPGTEKFKISTGEEMLAHLEELQIEKAVVMSSGETEGAMASVSGNQKCRELARRFPEKYVWLCNLDENCEETIEERLREYQRQGAVGIGEFMICRKINHPFVQAVFQAADRQSISARIWILFGRQEFSPCMIRTAPLHCATPMIIRIYNRYMKSSMESR